MADGGRGHILRHFRVEISFTAVTKKPGQTSEWPRPGNK